MKNATITLLCASLLACDGQSDDSSAAAPPPAGYLNYMVFIQDGTFDPADPDYEPPTKEQVQREIWKFSDAEVAQFEVDAKAFFQDRFGVDVDDPANAERLTFDFFILDPRSNYRAVTIANHEVPPEGWSVSDAYYGVIVTDPAGFELGGDFTGVTMPVGSALAYGYYHIESDSGETFAIAFQSASPFVFDALGNMMFRCELFSEEFGAGEASGVFHPSQADSGEFTVELRNVLTFH
jgi:hypothetical protein